jgi:hypothetical protein
VLLLKPIKVIDNYKHPSFLCYGINYGQKSFMKQAPEACIVKYYRPVMYGLHSKLVCLHDQAYVIVQANMFVHERRH